MSLFAGAIVEKRDTIGVSGAWKKMMDGIIAQLRTSAGVSVTPDAAMRLGVFYANVKVLSEDVAKLPLKLYERLIPRGKAPATEDPLYNLVHRKPNPEMTSYELREAVTSHMVGWGNGYLYKEMDRLGNVTALWPLLPNQTHLRKTSLPDGRELRFYEVTFPNGRQERIPAYRICHLRGLTFDAEDGYVLHTQAKESIGLAMAEERYASSYFANDATPRTVLKHPGKLKDPSQTNIRESWEERFRGVDKSHLIAILEEGMDIQTIGIDPEKSSLIESRELSVERICGWFRMPPHKVSHLKRSTFSNIEHQALEYVGDALMPWLVRWEQRLGADLLSEEKQLRMFFEHQVAGLLRGDFQARMNGYRVGREIGLYSVNDILDLENMNPIGPEGDVRHVPQNWMLLSTNPPPQPVADVNKRTAELLEEIDGGPRVRARFEPLIDAVIADLANREQRSVGGMAGQRIKGDAAKFRSWAQSFYPELAQTATQRVIPVLRAIAESLAESLPGWAERVDDYLMEASERLCNTYQTAGEEIRKLLEDDQVEDPTAAITDWLTARRQQMNDWGAAELDNVLVRFKREEAANA